MLATTWRSAACRLPAPPAPVPPGCPPARPRAAVVDPVEPHGVEGWGGKNRSPSRASIFDHCPRPLRDGPRSPPDPSRRSLRQTTMGPTCSVASTGSSSRRPKGKAVADSPSSPGPRPGARRRLKSGSPRPDQTRRPGAPRIWMFQSEESALRRKTVSGSAWCSAPKNHVPAPDGPARDGPRTGAGRRAAEDRALGRRDLERLQAPCVCWAHRARWCISVRSRHRRGCRPRGTFDPEGGRGRKCRWKSAAEPVALDGQRHHHVHRRVIAVDPRISLR